MRNIIFFFSFLLFSQIDLAGQCVVHGTDLDLSIFPASSGSTGTVGIPIGQTFTACQDGNVTSVDVTLGHPLATLLAGLCIVFGCRPR